MLPRVIIVPGNHETSIEANWYLDVKRRLEENGFSVVAKTMPDGYLARKEIWLPFIEKELENSPNAIIVGHSSGAVAALRYLETHTLEGVVIVGACYTDLGSETERLSNYYSAPWHWETIKKNAKWIIQYASVDDPFIPIHEAQFIHEKLGTDYHEDTSEGHYGSSHKEKKEFLELTNVILAKYSLLPF
ncbi:MAG: alpha/beta hydrolase [archaeon]